MRLAEWESCAIDFLNKEEVGDFVNYLNEVWQSRIRYIDAFSERAEGTKKGNQRFFDFTWDNRICARNYVGVVQYGATRIEVFPKILKCMERSSRNWQRNLMYWLGYCRKIRFPFSLAAIEEVDFEDFLECLIYIFAHYTEEILTQQPFQAYQSMEEETTFLKGRLVFNEYIKNNLITGQWQQFYCEYSPFVHDNLFNRIVKYVSRRLMDITRNASNRHKLDSILAMLDDVSDIACVAQDCDLVKLNSLFERHIHVLSLCRLYLSNLGLDVDSGNNQNFCFLVPMEYVFEDFLFGFIADKWPGLCVEAQSGAYLTAGREFSIANDIYVENQLIIDTKYKIRAGHEDSGAGVGHADLYQMVSYAIARGCKEVTMIYPGEREDCASFSIASAFLTSSINIKVQNIDITIGEVKDADALLIGRISQIHPVFL